MSSTETCAWITPEKARMLCPNAPDQVTLGVTLYQPDRLEDQAAVILKDLGLGDISFTTNLAYNDARLETANDQAAPYYLVNTFVILCGILMIYNIMRISTEQNIHFYGRVKSLGMTPKQIGHLLRYQALSLCIVAIPAGWIVGFPVSYTHLDVYKRQRWPHIS